MGILPIGFFSPLPLAMMIPFMATQSLAMGEAFGKSFQYGKRKISSMTNEEFNKLTFHDLMVEQTANISAIVPELNKQMSQSKEMQKAIFQEMVNLIPTFFDSLFSALDPKHIENPSLISNTSQISNVRQSGRDNVLNQEAIDDLKKLLDKALTQQGTKEDLANKITAAQLAENQRIYDLQQAEIQATNRSEIQKQIQLNKIIGDTRSTKQILETEEWNAWSAKLSELKQEIIDIKIGVNSPSSNVRSRSLSNLSRKRQELKVISNDYRNPNPQIQRGVIQLRKEIARGIH